MSELLSIEYLEELITEAYLEETLGFDEYLDLLKERYEDILHMDDEAHPFVMQDHWRGRGAHVDHRWKVTSMLQGMTIAAMKEGATAVDVTTEQQAQKLMNDPSIWKFSNDPGATRCFADSKELQDPGWLKVSGVIQPGDVGSTRKETGVYAIRDSGNLYLGAQQPYFKELFLEGKKYTGRWIYRMVSRRSPERTKTRFLWLFGKPLDQLPYVLSRRAQNQNWIPPQSISALPPDIKSKIPSELQYWMPKEESKRLELRNQLRDAIKRGTIKIQLEESIQYGYSHRTWKKRQVVREGPSDQSWDLFIEENENSPLIHLELDSDVLQTGSSSAFVSKESNHEWLDKEGDIAPGTKYNNTIDTPAKIESITTGTLIIDEMTDDFLKLRFLTGSMRGSWTLRREQKGQAMFVLSRSSAKLQEIGSDEVIKKDLSRKGLLLPWIQARAIIEGERKEITTSEKAPEGFLNTPIYLMSEDRIHGIIKLTSETKNGGYTYKFTIEHLYVPAKAVKTPEGKVWIQNW